MTTGNPTSSPAPAPAPRKRSAFRIFLWVVIVIVLILVIGVVVVMFKLDEIVRTTVQTQSAASLNVPTQLQSADVSLLGGSVTLNGFDIGSPSGFKSQMMQFGQVGVEARVSELRDDPIKVSAVNIKNPKMVIEMAGTDFNIKKFADALPPTDPNAKPIKLIIGSLNVDSAQVVLKLDTSAMSALPGIGKSLGGLRDEYTIRIPSLSLQNVGTGEGNQNGAAIKEVVSLLVTQLAAKAADSNDLPPELKQLLSLNVNDLAGSLKQKLGEQANQQLSKISGDLTKNLPPDTANALNQVLKNPQSATTNPGALLQQGLGGLMAPKEKKSKAPSTRPSR